MRSKNRQQQQTQPRVTVGRGQHSSSNGIPSPQEKLRAQVERREKSDARVRELEAENAQLKLNQEFHTLDRQCDEILLLRIQAMKLSPEEARRQAHVLTGGIARHRAKGLPARKFDPYVLLNKDAERHGRAVRTGSGDNPLSEQLPPPKQEGRAPAPGAVVPGDVAASEAAARGERERAARAREQTRSDREVIDAAYKRHPGLTNPAIGSVPGSGGYYG